MTPNVGRRPAVDTDQPAPSTSFAAVSRRLRRLGRLRELRPTRRGYAVAAVAMAAFALGATAGARSLNAVVVPALVGLAAAAFQLASADPPAVERMAPRPGFPGETRRVGLEVEAEVPITVSDSVDAGAGVTLPAEGRRDGRDAVTVRLGHGGSFDYEIELDRRGTYTLGPARCRLTDSLGLFRTEHETDATSTAVVYPDVFALEGEDLSSLIHRVHGDERSTFEHLRDYDPGDAMRDIHWRASAKQASDDYVVAEYRSRSEATHVDIVGESALGGADAMTATVASVALHLHDAGVTVAVSVPDGECIARPEDTASLLRLLARTGDGWVDREAGDAADVYVHGEDGGRATLRLDGRELPFESVAGAHRGREVIAGP